MTMRDPFPVSMANALRRYFSLWPSPGAAIAALIRERDLEPGELAIILGAIYDALPEHITDATTASVRDPIESGSGEPDA
jgi:hypothetical protein